MVIMGFPDSSGGKEPACNAGDPSLIPGLGRCPEEGKGYRLQYSGLDNSMDCAVHGATKSRTRLSNFHFHFLKAGGRTRGLGRLPGVKNWDGLAHWFDSGGDV